MKVYLVDLYQQDESGMFERIRREYLKNEKQGVREIELHIEYGVEGVGVMQEVNIKDNEMSDTNCLVVPDSSKVLIQALKAYYKNSPVLYSAAKLNGRRKNNYIKKSKAYILSCAPY